MSWQAYLLSLLAGLAVGAFYGLSSIKSPAPPVIALIGLLGMLGGEALVLWYRGQPDVIATCLHLKSFTPAPPKGEAEKPQVASAPAAGTEPPSCGASKPVDPS